MELLSDTMMMVTTTEMVSCLNPCSNGILSDNLKESNLRFLPHPCYSGIPFLARELVPSVRFFRKCMRFHLSFQRKNAIFSLKILIYNEICFRKSNGCLNNFRHLRKPYFYLFSKSLKMNTLNHRSKSHISCFFANVGIKFGKRKICENFSSASKDGKMIK